MLTVTSENWQSPPQWQVAVDTVRWLTIFASSPLLFFSVARMFQSPTKSQKALSISSAAYIVTTVYAQLDLLGRPATLRLVGVVVAVGAGLWGGWYFYRGETLRYPRFTARRIRPDRSPPTDGGASA